MITDEKFKEIEAYVTEATTGPWEFSTTSAKRAAGHLEQRGGRTILYLDSTRNIKLDEATKHVDADMDFITRARDDLRLLVDELLHQRRAIDDLREAYERQTEEWSALYHENLKLKEALELYAEQRSYRRHQNTQDGTIIPAFIEKDLGQAARVALGHEFAPAPTPAPEPPPEPPTQSE